MIKRAVLIGSPGRLSLRRGNLIFEADTLTSIPLEDVGLLIVEEPTITMTHQLLAACVNAGVAVVTCDKTHMPVGLLQPLHGHTLHTAILAKQVNVTAARCRQAWKRLISAKIANQASVVERVRGEAGHLTALSCRIKPGDPDNREAQAARVYWRQLFGQEFRRSRRLPGINSCLNYGYAVLRAVVSRAVVAAGLHPALGIHHRNQYNAFALSDDLMEPLRPAIDQRVYDLSQGQEKLELDTSVKSNLIEVTSQAVFPASRSEPLMVALSGYVANVRQYLFKEANSIEIPTV